MRKNLKQKLMNFTKKISSDYVKNEINTNGQAIIGLNEILLNEHVKKLKMCATDMF